MINNDNPTSGTGTTGSVASILVMGVGNVLLKDEGVGVHVVEHLRHAPIPLPQNIEIIDGGTMGMELMMYLEGREKAVVIDVIEAGVEPGTIFRFAHGDIREAKQKKLSFHQLSFLDALKMAEFMGQQLPEIIFIAIQPKDITPGTELTPEIEAKIPTIIEMIKKEF